MNTVIYARVSSKEQEQEGFSIPAQLKLLKDYARKNDLNIVKEFVDVETAKQAGRTNFNEMVSFLGNGSGIRTVLCEKTDRLYRNFRDYVTIDDLDLEIHLVKESEVISRDSKSHQKFIHGIKVLMAKNYIDNLSEETKKGMLQKAEQGLFPSFAPLGYLNNSETKRIKPDEGRSPIVQKIFRLYATGSYSLSKIVKMAYEEGLRSKNGKKVGKSAIEAILKNPIYYGDFRWDGRLYKGTHGPIITKDLFDAVQEAFSSHNRPKQTKHDFAFTGLITCAKCGCAITAEVKKGKYIYYHCTQFKGKCGNGYIREEALAEKFAEIVKSVQIDEEILEWVREALLVSHKDEKEYHDKQIANLQTQYSRLQKRIDKIYVDKLDGVINEEFYQEKAEDWREEQRQTLDTIERHQNAQSYYFSQGIHILELAQKAYSLYLRQKPTEQRKLLNFLLSNCTLDGVSLYPTYNKPFDLLAKYNQNENWRPWQDSNLRHPV